MHLNLAQIVAENSDVFEEILLLEGTIRDDNDGFDRFAEAYRTAAARLGISQIQMGYCLLHARDRKYQ